ncbi:MAG: AbgT family transporter, partial [Oscillibacter sp.]
AAHAGLQTGDHCLAGVCANIAGDAGVILAISFGAILFKALGRNPWAGITIAYGSVQAGYGANLFPSTADALYAGISGPLAEEFGFVVHPMSNYIFLFVCTWFLALAFAFVSEKFIVPLFGEAPRESRSRLENSAIEDNFVLTEAEHRGLKFAGIGAAVFLVFLVIGMLPGSIFPAVFGFLRNPETDQLFPKSPFLDGMIPLIGLLFLAVGIPFGYGVGTIKNKGDIPPILQKGVNKMASLIFILFPCSLFVYQFNRSNLSTVISVGGERFLNSIHLTGLPMLVVFIIIVAFINIFMYSGSAKWMILAPIFIPMFATMGVHPAVTQLAARIGDSCTNGLTPLNAALIAVLALMEQYRDPELNPEKPGMGTVISSQIPLAITSLVVMTALFIIFILAGLPVGIGM